MSTNYSKLVEAIVDGQVHRYGEIVRQFDARVRHFVSRRMRDPGSIDDVVQETFYRAFTKLDCLDDAEQLGRWLVVIARNCVNDHFRKVARRRAKEIEAAVDAESRRDGILDRRANRIQNDWIWNEVDLLSAQAAQILRLRYLRGLSYREISHQLGVNESTVSGRIYEARKAIKQQLIRKGYFHERK